MTATVAGVIRGGNLELLEQPKGLREGRVLVTIEGEPDERVCSSTSSRRTFMKLPLSERRRILSEQAERLASHYQQNTEWKSWLDGDIVEY